MQKWLFLLLTLSVGNARCQRADHPSASLKNVGYITPDSDKDDPAFTVCDERQIYEYYNFGNGLQFEGEKIKIITHFKQFNSTEAKGQSGVLTIRFVVNCEGKTGRFRLQGMDDQYQPFEFSPQISKQLLELTKKLEGWKIATMDSYRFDYYQYLSFRIKNGKLIEIMP